MEYGCVLIISAMSSAFPFIRTSTIQEVLVCPHPYFLTICESRNIHPNSGPAWSDATNGILCSTLKSVKRTSAFMTPTSVIAIQNSVPFSYREILPDVTFSTVLNTDFSITNCANCVVNSQSWFANDQPLHAIHVSERLFDTRFLFRQWFYLIIFPIGSALHLEIQRPPFQMKTRELTLHIQ